MADTGSLIRIHYHENQLDVLDFLSDEDGKLYFKNAPVYTQVSSDSKNAITKLPDGIFVDGSYFLTETQYNVLTQFSYDNSLLKFGDRVISWEYTLQQIQLTNKEIWDVLNPEYPQDDLVIGYMSTSDDKIFVCSNNVVFLGKDGA